MFKNNNSAFFHQPIVTATDPHTFLNAVAHTQISAFSNFNESPNLNSILESDLEDVYVADEDAATAPAAAPQTDFNQINADDIWENIPDFAGPSF